jgi:hypothetical protein
MADFTADQIAELRRRRIRDLVNTGTGEMLSHYNRAVQKQFVSDVDLNAEKANVERDWEGPLSIVYDQTRRDRLRFGDSDTQARAKAQALLDDTIVKLVAANILESMTGDSGFMAYVPAAVSSAWAKTQAETIARWRTLAQRRQGGLGQRRVARR